MDGSCLLFPKERGAAADERESLLFDWHRAVARAKEWHRNDNA